jgi:hypothetical protein
MLQFQRRSKTHVAKLDRFLLAKLHLESLSQKINRKEVRSSLRTLPTSLNTTYSNALERIYRQAPDAVDLAEAVLFWVLCVKRPLTVLELQQIYATQELPEETALEDGDLPAETQSTKSTTRYLPI